MILESRKEIEEIEDLCDSEQTNLKEVLTPREVVVMTLYSNPFLEKTEIADRLNISMHTLNSHINNCFIKLGETDRFAAAFKFFKLYPQYRTLIELYIAS